MFQKLLHKGVIVRPFMGNWLRITVGSKEQNEILAQALKEVL